jgi:hypothetical protein
LIVDHPYAFGHSFDNSAVHLLVGAHVQILTDAGRSPLVLRSIRDPVRNRLRSFFEKHKTRFRGVFALSDVHEGRGSRFFATQRQSSEGQELGALVRAWCRTRRVS